MLHSASELLKWKPRALRWLSTMPALLCLLFLTVGQSGAAAQTVATPTYSPSGGTYTGAQTVTISDSTSGATIYYTTNGTTPNTSSTKYTAPFSVATSQTVEAIGVLAGSTNSAVGTAGYSIIGGTPTAATPTFSPAAGTYTGTQSVTISDSTSGSTIYYTTNGTTPTTSSTKYTAAISVAASETIEAIATATGYNNSAIASAAYTINSSTPTATTPTFSPAAGSYASAQSVTISDSTSGSTIYYTTNGATPTTSSAQYTGAISVGTSETVKAIAAASGYNNSAVASAAYTITSTQTAATPTYSPTGGTYTGTQTVTISSATSGASIYYTTNGTTPSTSSTQYTGPISVATSETVEAIATASGYNTSAVGTAGYTINAGTPTAATPTFSPAAGSYSSAQSVTISDTTSGSTIYYTTNGTTPTTSSTKYTGAISVTASETIEAIATASGYNNSAVGSAAYTITTTSAPGTPTGLAATAGNTQVALTWSAGSGATSYNVYRGTTAGGESTTAIATGVTSTSYTNTGLTNGTAYYYKVAAVNASGTSGQSNEASATPSSGVSVPSAPSTLSATPAATQVSLSWSSSSGATSYNVYRGTSSGGESSTPIVTGVTSTSYTNTGLTNGTTYYFKVAAVNSAGTSALSGEVSATPQASTGSAYYVSPSGNDGNAGSLSSPWLTPQHAANVATPGSTVYLEAGTYAPFTVNVSGSASGGYITFINYNGGNAVIDGTGFTGSYDQGLIHMVDQSYIIISGLEIRNGTGTSSFNPCGICAKTYSVGAGHIQFLNNYIHNIVNGSSSNAHGILVRGEYAGAAMNNATVSGNTITACQLGDSESLTMAGNLNTFTVSNNLVHDNNNIGIDAEGGYSSIAGGAQSTNGTITGNTVYNCSTINNPNYKVYSCAGLYDDGGTNVTFSGNTVYGCDLGVQVAAENSGYYSSNVTVRNNLIYQNQTYGIAIGGYSSSSVGGTKNCTIVNNTVYNDDLQNWWCGEIGVRWQVTGTLFDNNIVYAGTSNDVFVKDVGTDGSSVGSFNYNDYYSAGGTANAKWQWINQTTYDVGLSAWQSASGQDANSVWGNPLFNSTSAPFNFNLGSGSPALNTGNYGLGSTDYGTVDFAGNARTKNSTIDMGAYEN